MSNLFEGFEEGFKPAFQKGLGIGAVVAREQMQNEREDALKLKAKQEAEDLAQKASTVADFLNENPHAKNEDIQKHLSQIYGDNKDFLNQAIQAGRVTHEQEVNLNLQRQSALLTNWKNLAEVNPKKADEYAKNLAENGFPYAANFIGARPATTKKDVITINNYKMEDGSPGTLVYNLKTGKPVGTYPTILKTKSSKPIDFFKDFNSAATSAGVEGPERGLISKYALNLKNRTSGNEAFAITYSTYQDALAALEAKRERGENLPGKMSESQFINNYLKETIDSYLKPKTKSKPSDEFPPPPKSKPKPKPQLKSSHKSSEENIKPYPLRGVDTRSLGNKKYPEVIY